MTKQKTMYPWVAVPFAALLLSLLRWWAQGTGNMWSKMDLRAYAPDDLLGWRRLDEGAPWIGLDAVAIVVGFACAVVLGAWLVKRRESRKATRWHLGRAAVVAAALMPLAIPAWAFHRGWPPPGVRETRPVNSVAAPALGIAAALAVPAGTYRVLAHNDVALTATLKAGGETFEARFSAVTGAWRADPSDLTQPMTALLTARASSVKTGIELRDTHAQEKLQAEIHPEIRFVLTRLMAADTVDSAQIRFRAQATLTLAGREHEVEVTGRIRIVDKTLQEKFELPASPALYVEAQFELNLTQTAVGNDGTFDEDVVPISATLILVHNS